MSERRNIFQKVSDATYGIITPGNVLDAVGMALIVKYAPKVDTRGGVVGVLGAYLIDLADGASVNATGTATRLGDVLDRVGDKVKEAYLARYTAGRPDLVSQSLLGAIVAQNTSNALATTVDRIRNGHNPQVVPDDSDRHGAFFQNAGLLLQIIGAEVDRSGYPREADILRELGNVSGWGGLSSMGVPTTIKYWGQALGARE